MRIDRYLFDLLHHHDCVVVPGFGGFVAQRSASFFNLSQQFIYPPSKLIAFNESLKNNDGLLAHHVAAAEKISYSEACTAIDIFVFEIVNGLNITGTFLLNKTGTLKRDSENKIQFQPDFQQNYLFESFGLSPLQLPSLAVNEKKTEVLFPASSKKEKTNKGFKVLDWIPVAAMVALLIIAQVNLSKINNGFAGLAFFMHVAQSPVAPANDVRLTNVLPVPATATPVLENRAVEQTIAENQPVLEEKTEEIPAEPVVAETKPVLNFHIIAGCFRIEDNATRLEADLKAKGFAASIIGKNAKGLTMVSAAAFTSIEEAQNGLARLKEKLDGGAWVYHPKE